MSLVDIKKTETLNHPYEEGVTFDIRRLRAVEMDEASDAKVKRTMSVWGDSLDAIAKATGTVSNEDTIASRVAKYDGSTLLQYALVGWSYPEPLSPETIKQLEGATRDWLVEEVVTRNTRPLPSSKTGEGILSQATSPTS